MPDSISFSENQSLPGDRAVPGTDTLALSEATEFTDATVGDTDTFGITELENPPLDEFTVVFNDNPENPGFVITIDGLLTFEQSYDLINVVRRDVTGRYPDRRVRGLSNIVPQQNRMVITDYEAPLNVEFEYYVQLTQGTASFFYGPAIPTPLPYIPIQDTYGEGLAYFKPIDVPELAQPVQIEDFRTWSRPARILAEHDVLGRRNKVIVSDVRAGREGSVSGLIILRRGQTLDVFESIINPGAVILIQNHNAVMSGHDDIYVQFRDVEFERLTPMVRYGLQDNHLHNDELVIRYQASFSEVDRPDPTGVMLLDFTWETVLDTFNNFDRVRELRETWLDLFKRPVGPDGDS